MPSNYNKVVFRQLHPTLDSALHTVKEAMSVVQKKGASEIASYDLKDIQYLSGSLEMVGCYALSKLVWPLKDVVEGLRNAPARGWDGDAGKSIAALAERLAEMLLVPINEIMSGEQASFVSLFPVWNELSVKLGQGERSPNELFEVTPYFKDLKFESVPPGYLVKIGNGACDRLKQAILELKNETTSEGEASATKKVEAVFEWLYGVKHKRNFQALWLVTWARIRAFGIIKTDMSSDQGSVINETKVESTLGDSEEFISLLEDVLVEVQKFSTNARTPSLIVINRAVAPLLFKWSDRLQDDGVMLSVKNRLNLGIFWEEVSLAQSASDNGHGYKKMNKDANAKNMLDALSDMVDDWEGWAVGSGDMRSVVMAMAGVVKAQKALELQLVDPLVAQLRTAIEWCANQGKNAVPEIAIYEIAATVLTIEEIVGSPSYSKDEALSRAKTQRERLKTSLEGEGYNYYSLPSPFIGAQQSSRKVTATRENVLSQMLQDIKAVEDGLSQVMDGSTEYTEFEKIKDGLIASLDIGASVLGMLMLHSCSVFQKSLLDVVNAISSDEALLADSLEQKRVAVILTALMDSLQLRIDGVPGYAVPLVNAARQTENAKLEEQIIAVASEASVGDLGAGLSAKAPAGNQLQIIDVGLASKAPIWPASTNGDDHTEIAESVQEMSEEPEIESHATAKEEREEEPGVDDALSRTAEHKQQPKEATAENAEAEDGLEIDPPSPVVVEKSGLAAGDLGPEGSEVSRAQSGPDQTLESGEAEARGRGPVSEGQDTSDAYEEDSGDSIFKPPGVFEDATACEQGRLHDFVEEVSAPLQKLSEASAEDLSNFDETDWDSLARVFHTIKGSGRFIDLFVLADAAQVIEHKVKRYAKGRLRAPGNEDGNLLPKIPRLATRFLGVLGSILEDREAFIYVGDIFKDEKEKSGAEDPGEQEAPSHDTKNLGDNENGSDLEDSQIEPGDAIEGGVPELDLWESEYQTDAARDSAAGLKKGRGESQTEEGSKEESEEDVWYYGDEDSEKDGVNSGDEGGATDFSRWVTDIKKWPHDFCEEEVVALAKDFIKNGEFLVDIVSGTSRDGKEPSESLFFAAHNLSTITAILGWDAWAQECANVEYAIKNGHIGDDVQDIANRWLSSLVFARKNGVSDISDPQVFEKPSEGTAGDNTSDSVDWQTIAASLGVIMRACADIKKVVENKAVAEGQIKDGQSKRQR